MKKVSICILGVLFLLNIKAQNASDDKGSNKANNSQTTKPIKTDNDNRFIITYDYGNGTINHKLPPGFKIKRIRPKVGSFISVKVLNLPAGFTINGEAEFENGNIEGSAMFSNFFKTESPANKDAPSGDQKPKADQHK